MACRTKCEFIANHSNVPVLNIKTGTVPIFLLLFPIYINALCAYASTFIIQVLVTDKTTSLHLTGICVPAKNVYFKENIDMEMCVQYKKEKCCAGPITTKLKPANQRTEAPCSTYKPLASHHTYTSHTLNANEYSNFHDILSHSTHTQNEMKSVLIRNVFFFRSLSLSTSAVGAILQSTKKLKIKIKRIIMSHI